MLYLSRYTAFFMDQGEEPTKLYRDVAVLLSAASILTESPSLIDRMANCLNQEPAVRAVNDALRIIESDQMTGKPRLRLEKNEAGRYTYVVVDREQGGPARIFGRIPSGETVRKFIEAIYRDITTARKIGTLASALVVESQLRIEWGQAEKEEEGG
jgi:CRISPR type I-A-associated protein Csa5